MASVHTNEDAIHVLKLVRIEQYLDKEDVVNLSQASRATHRDFKDLASRFVLILLKSENARLKRKIHTMARDYEVKIEERYLVVQLLARMMREDPETSINDSRFEGVFDALGFTSRDVEEAAYDQLGFINFHLERDDEHQFDEPIAEVM